MEDEEGEHLRTVLPTSIISLLNASDSASLQLTLPRTKLLGLSLPN